MHISTEDIKVEHVTFIEAGVEAANDCKASNREDTEMIASLTYLIYSNDQDSKNLKFPHDNAFGSYHLVSQEEDCLEAEFS